jgi:squalene synthase HpnC
MPWDFRRELAAWGPASPRPAVRGLAAARAYCAHVTRRHYENFTVASLVLPRRLLPHFQAIYAYCRWSDDLADETGGGAAALPLLDWWRGELLRCYDGQPRHPVLIALAATIRQFAIPPEPFLNLLVAFTQDQHIRHYDRFEDLLGYCRNSANPVGHLVLYLFECFDACRAALADDICTGLQLANFWQDVARDWAIGRVYLPGEDRRRFGYTDADLAAQRFTPAFRELLRFEVERTRPFFDRGAALVPLLPREAQVEVTLFVQGGRATLQAIERCDYNVWAQRPVVSKFRKARLLAAALSGRWLA